MSSLSRLPKYPILAFLGVWCDLLEIANLDAALCNLKERRIFLTYLSELTFEGFDCDNNAWHFFWINTRKIKLRAIYVTDISLSLYKCFDPSKIIRLYIRHTCLLGSKKNFVALINLCDNLTAVSLEDGSRSILYSKSKNIRQEIIQNITDVKIQTYEHLPNSEFVTEFPLQFTNLKSIQINFTIYDEDGMWKAKRAHVLKIVEMNVNLVKINFITGRGPVFDKSTVDSILRICPQLAVFYVGRLDKFNVQVIENILNTTNIEEFKLTYNDDNFYSFGYNKLTHSLKFTEVGVFEKMFEIFEIVSIIEHIEFNGHYVFNDEEQKQIFEKLAKHVEPLKTLLLRNSYPFRSAVSAGNRKQNENEFHKFVSSCVNLTT